MSNNRYAPPRDEADLRCEEGRIGVLMAACLMLVTVFVLVSSALTAVAIEDRAGSCPARIAWHQALGFILLLLIIGLSLGHEIDISP